MSICPKCAGARLYFSPRHVDACGIHSQTMGSKLQLAGPHLATAGAVLAQHTLAGGPVEPEHVEAGRVCRCCGECHSRACRHAEFPSPQFVAAGVVLADTAA